MGNLENKVEVIFYREQFERNYRQFTDEEWEVIAGWIEDYASFTIWQTMTDYLTNELEEDLLEHREENDGLIS